MRREAAYRWLAARMGLPSSDCHMAYFGESECDRVIRLCRDFGQLPDSPRRIQ